MHKEAEGMACHLRVFELVLSIALFTLSPVQPAAVPNSTPERGFSRKLTYSGKLLMAACNVSATHNLQSVLS